MLTGTLKYINETLETAGIPYEFGEFRSDISGLQEYWVGEYQEIEPYSEDGLEEAQFILTGTARGDSPYTLLGRTKKMIRDLFPAIYGNTEFFEDGSAVAIFYSNALQIPTDVAELKRMQINLTVKEWRVN